MSPTLQRTERSLDRTFLVLSFFLLLVQLPFFPATVLPMHDTMHVFGVFHAFYNEFFFRGKIMQWFPEVSYGLPAQMNQLMSLSPLSYFTMLAGILFRVRDVLFLYKLSLFLEAFVFLGGVYQLARYVFLRKDTAFFVGLCASGSIMAYTQVFLNFRVVYLFPWALLYFARFVRHRKGVWLWIGGLGLLLALWGSLPYYAVLWLMVLFFMALPFSTRFPGLVTRLFVPRKKSFVLMGLLFILLAIYLVACWHLTHGVILVSSGRDSQSGQIAVTEFTDYGGRSSLREIMSSLLFAQPFFLSNGSKMDNTVYIGFLPLFFFLWAVAVVRKKGFYSFSLAYIILLMLAVSPVIARALYFFPGMRYFRHTGLVMGLARFFLIMAAGYGWDNFWREEGWRHKLFLGLVIFFGFLWVGAVRFLLMPNDPVDPLPLFFQLKTVLPGAAALLFLLALAWRGRSDSSPGLSIRLVKVFIVFALWDMVLFQVTAYHQLPHLRTGEERAVLSSRFVCQRLFQDRRFPLPQDARAQRAYQFMEIYGKAPRYTYNSTFYQFEPCFIPIRVDMICPGVDSLYQFNPVLPTILAGCRGPKLQLIHRVTWMTSEQRERTFRNLVRTLERLSTAMPGGPQSAVAYLIAGTRGQLILPAEGLDAGRQAAESPVVLSEDERGDIQVEEFNSELLRCRVRVPVSPGEWMFYPAAYHPGWRASIDGKKIEISQAYGAFMAVFVPAGDHQILFEFYNGIGTLLSYALALIGSLAGAGMLFLAIRILWNRY
ncbi:MAG TPA: YfhO family protein [Candidatus Omnitrophota bacterium]|nr:YfhO family protein [Candidatus Omnitrophota bacterium]HQO58392.1 YfhO family protein [Candidatus Omnitrophota bacterium]